MSEKKKYESPEIFKVELNQEQAILASCSTAAAGTAGDGGSFCKGNCRNWSRSGGTDSGANPS